MVSFAFLELPINGVLKNILFGARLISLSQLSPVVASSLAHLCLQTPAGNSSELFQCPAAASSLVPGCLSRSLKHSLEPELTCRRGCPFSAPPSSPSSAPAASPLWRGGPARLWDPDSLPKEWCRLRTDLVKGKWSQTVSNLSQRSSWCLSPGSSHTGYFQKELSLSF